MNTTTTHQDLDRISVIALALAVITLAVAWVVNMPAAPEKTAQATPVVVVASEASAPADEGRYKIIVTGLRLRPVTPTAVANVGTSGPRS
jgi:hypothetical protein